MDKTSGTTKGQKSNGRYRSGIVARYPLGSGQELVYCGSSRSAGVLRSELATLVDRCRRFRTLEDHAQQCCGSENADNEALAATLVRLKELAACGFLICDSEVPGRQSGATAREHASVPIKSLCFPTCNRVDTLERGLQTYITNCRQYGKTNDFVVMDDSPEADTRASYRQMLRKLKAEHGADIKYAGKEEKDEFLSSLIANRELPPDVVNFALFGDRESGLDTYGANRNAVLLHTIGDHLFCSDDDTICRIAAAPLQSKGSIAFSNWVNPGSGPEETWLFPDRRSALDSACFVETSLLEMHERFLGMDLSNCIAEVADDMVVDLDETDVNFHWMLGSGQGRIRVTMNGILGDCGWTSPLYHILNRGATLDRLTRNESEYRTLRISREFLRVVDRFTISNKPPLQGMFMGLDNREALPPYLPVGKGEDILFGNMLSICFNDAFYARLPWALLHDPVETRFFSSEQIAVPRPFIAYLYQLVGLVAASLGVGILQCNATEKLRILGNTLKEVGLMPRLEFKELVSLQIWKAASAEADDLERTVRQAGESRQFWTSDIRDYLKKRRDLLTTPEICVPHDLSLGRDSDEAMKLAQKIVWRYGRLLRWWPDIVDSARDLKGRECTLARSV